jgi:peptidoglycan/LPS O-acetylase OafA/YrhL
LELESNLENTTIGKVHFYNLDVLRFVCAIAVAFTHSYDAYFGWIGEPSFLIRFPFLKHNLNIFMHNLSMGVDMFFVISGFLITYLLLAEKQNFGNINIGKFIVRRSLRIWPLYYLAILIGFFIVKLSASPAPDYWANILFWNNFNAIHTMQWQFPFGHFWSICVEEHFYFVWPIIIFLTPSKKLPIVIIFLVVGSIAFRYFEARFFENRAQVQFILHLHTFSRIDEILVGAALACFHFFRPITIHIKLWIRIVVYSLFILILGSQPHLDFWVWGIYSVMFKKFIYLAFIVFWLVNYLFNPEAFFNFKSKNILHYLGKISFGIYIYHNMFLQDYITRFVYRFGITNMATYFIFYFLFLIIISVISFELYEKYFLKLKDKFSLIKTQR